MSYRNNIRILGLMATCFFPLAPEMIDSLASYCDALCIRFQVRDDPSSDYKLLDYAAKHPKTIKTLISREKWNRWNWREDLIGMSDTLRPEVVLFLDDDEKFGDGFQDELKYFMASDFTHMMFHFEMCPAGTPIFPEDRHAKVFKWQYKLRYLPYPGWARMATYVEKGKGYKAQSKIIHYSQACGNKVQHR